MAAAHQAALGANCIAAPFMLRPPAHTTVRHEHTMIRPRSKQAQTEVCPVLVHVPGSVSAPETLVRRRHPIVEHVPDVALAAVAPHLHAPT